MSYGPVCTACGMYASSPDPTWQCRCAPTPQDERSFMYRWAASKSRSDSPSVAELEADGWTVEHVDPRYGNSLMRKAIE